MVGFRVETFEKLLEIKNFRPADMKRKRVKLKEMKR